MFLRAVIILVFSLSGWNALASDGVDVVIAYVERKLPLPPTLSNLDPVPGDEGLAGFHLGIRDNATTGKFLGHRYQTETLVVSQEDNLSDAVKLLLAKTPFLVVNLPKADLLQIASLPEAKQAMIINAASQDTDLRDTECRHNIVHTIPSRAMLGDALAQFAVKKRWAKWVMIAGSRKTDKALATAFENSADKFGIQLRDKKTWAFDADMRRSAASEVPLFTQDFPDYDLLVIADEPGDFARYIPFQTWLPRPVAGSAGLRPVTWSAVIEQHGAAQLQSRFQEAANRKMRPQDYAAWVAARVVGEAVTRTSSADPVTLRNYILSDRFELGGFKGRKLTFRPWNGQLRQPVPLAHAGAVAALAPLEGFLHQHNELDTLGLDRADSKCTEFGE